MAEETTKRLVAQKAFSALPDPPKLSSHITKGVLTESGAVAFDLEQKRWIDTVNTHLRSAFDQQKSKLTNV